MQDFTIDNLNHADVSIIIPIHNGTKWIKSCFESIFSQSAINSSIKIEICICDDVSNDNTKELLGQWKMIFENCAVPFKIIDNKGKNPFGVGYSKNRAVSISSGIYLCFQDVDDVMLPNRITSQYEKALTLPKNTLLGSKFLRDPPNSTIRYTNWANNLSIEQLRTQIYTSHGPTVIMPTWFCHRDVFYSVGGFDERDKGVPEDLIFFYKHIFLGGHISRVDEFLLIYKYHLGATTFSILEETIWNLRVERLEQIVLPQWKYFTIWNAGKKGRKFYRSLSEVNKNKVAAFCDVDEKKINKRYVPFNEKTRRSGTPIQIKHFFDASPPFIICIKLDMTDGTFESNLKMLHLNEGKDYVIFN